MLYTFYQFIKTVKDEKMSKYAIRSASVVLFAGIIAIFSWSFERYCQYISSIQDLKDAFAGIYGLCLAIQTTTLLIFFFVRLNMIFESTAFQLSKCTVNCFVSLFVCLFLLWFVIIVGVFGYNADVLKLLPLVALLFFINITIIISLSAMLIYKLIAVYKMEATKKEKDDGLITAITKTVILNAVCILSTILNVSGIVIYNAVSPSMGSVIFVGIMAIADMIANYFCVLISFKAFRSYYEKICKCTDDNCRKCVYWCITHETDAERSLAEMHRNMESKKTGLETVTVSSGGQVNVKGNC